jgi:hypothetical protein
MIMRCDATLETPMVVSLFDGGVVYIIIGCGIVVSTSEKARLWYSG